MKALTSITTMQDLADAAGVSLTTVSRVFSGSNKVSEKTKEKVMELVKQSGFYPNETARTMAAGKSRLIAVILPDIENPFFSKLLSEVEENCVKNGYTMIFFNSNGDSEKERDIVIKMMARQADGMIICMTKVKSEMIPVLRTAKFPVVVMARNIDGLNSVGIDHLEGMNIHRNDVALVRFLPQLLFEADIIVASGHRVNIGVTLQFPRLLFADIREAEDRFVQ